MRIITRKVEDLQPYENNPRKNDGGVKYVAESIRDFGFKVPIVIDKNGVIVAGHTRYLASIELGLEEVPCIVADDLDDEQVKEFRLVDNRTGEMAKWDWEMLSEELARIPEVDLSKYGLEESSFDKYFEPMEGDTSSVAEEDGPSPNMVVCPYCGELVEL